MTALVELEGVNGDWFTISGEGMGDEGIFLGTDIEGLYDAPVKVIRNSTARQTGSSYGGKRNLQRDIVFGLWVTDENGTPWEENDSRLRKAIDYEREFKLWITTDGSRRYLKVSLAEQPMLKLERDPRLLEREKVVLTCVAGDPWWYEDDVVSEWVSPTDTTGGSTALGVLPPVSNPTDNSIWLRWKLQGNARWTIPDYSWGNNDYKRAAIDATKLILTPTLLPADGHGRVETNPESRRERMSTTGNTQWQARWGGVDCMYPVPPYTPATNLPVRVTGAAAGVGIQCIQPRPWSRPWGLQ